MFHSLENWFTLLSGVIVLVMGLRVFWLDSTNKIYQFFLLSTIFLFVQNLFFFEMAHIKTLEAATRLRPWQESVWNLAAMSIFITMWYYSRKFVTRSSFAWEKGLFWSVILLSPFFFSLQAFTPYGHGEMVLIGPQKWGVQVTPYQWYDFARAAWVLISYLAGIYFAYLPFRHAPDRSSKRLRLFILIVFAVILLGSFTQNYVLTYFFEIPSALNEASSVFIAVLLCGLMLSNFQLFEIRSEYALPNLLRTMTNWFILTDQGFTIRQVNEALVNAFPHPLEDYQFLRISDLLPYDQWKTEEQLIKQLDVNQTHNAEFQLKLNGRTSYILLTVTPVFSKQGNKRGYVFVGTDLTSFKESELQVRAYANELEASNQALERFAYIASHDLKEPIRNIGNFAGLLKRRLGEGLSPDNTEFIDFIINNVKGMYQLIDSVMAVSLMGQNELDYQEIDSAELVEQAHDNLSTIFREKKAQLQQADLPIIYGDPILVNQLFQNLMENGLKYNENPTPCIEISYRPGPKPHFWEFTISDNGIGIDPEYREQVFEMFKRLHTRDTYQGTGIGLAICRRIVELHRGQIWIDSDPEKGGSQFRFLLPASPEALSPFRT